MLHYGIHDVKTMSYEQFQCYMLTMFSQSITHDMIYAKYMLHENLFHEMDFHYVMHFMILQHHSTSYHDGTRELAP